MDFGARRIDFLGLKFQLADEMAAGYAQAVATIPATLAFRPGTGAQRPKPSVPALVSDINGVNGRLQDLTYGYSQLRDMFQQQWLRTYRPANLTPVLERFDFTTQLWLSRIDKVRSAQRQWTDTKSLPAAADLGIPAPSTPVELPSTPSSTR